MSRPPITFTTIDKRGKPHDNKWFVRVGSKWRTFTEENFLEGVAWVQSQLGKTK